MTAERVTVAAGMGVGGADAGASATPLVGSARASARSRAFAWPGGRTCRSVFAPGEGRERLVAPAAVLGGALMTGGAFLPWLSFYAGLYPMRGVIGAWGWVLAAGGGVCALGGIVAWGQALGRARAAGWGAYGRMGRATRALARSIPVLGGVLTLFAAWLVVQLLLTYRALQANPMLVPRLGPGLFVALVGGLVMVAPPLVRALRRRGRAIEQRP